MKNLRTAIAGILALFVASAAIAQTYPTVPSRSVIGRIGTPGASGPSQAIPFATLKSYTGLKEVISTPTLSNYDFVFMGDNYANAVSRWPGDHKPLLFMDRLVNWDQINDNTVVDFSVLTAQSSTSNQYASFNCKTYITATAFNWNHQVCAEDQNVYNGSGTLTYSTSFLSFPSFNGPVTQRSAIWLLDGSGSGTIGTQYGFRCNEFTKATTNWCFYSGGATPNYMGGSLLLSTALTAIPTSAKLSVSKNAAAAANAPASNALIYGVNADGVSSVLQLDGYGTGANGGLISRAARGTAASPTNTLSGDSLLAINAYGYNSTGGFAGGSAFGQGLLSMVATEDFTSGGSGTAWDFWTNATGALTAVRRARIGSGLMVGTTTDPGAGAIVANTTVKATTGFQLTNMVSSSTAPVATTFCTSPSIPANNGTAAFTINVGTSCSTSVGTITMPAATTGWACSFANVTNPATSVPSQTGGSQTTVTLTNYVRTTGIAGNWTNSDVIRAQCTAY